MFVTLSLGFLLTMMQAAAVAPLGPGVSEALAAERRAVISFNASAMRGLISASNGSPA